KIGWCPEFFFAHFELLKAIGGFLLGLEILSGMVLRMLFPTTQTVKAETAISDDWLTPRRFAAFLAVFVLASWPQVFFGLQTFVFRDFGYYGYPIAFHLRESFWHGDIPLLNPLSYCGSPFLAQWNTQVLYPLNLFYVLLPLSWSLAVFCLLHLYLGGFGM